MRAIGLALLAGTAFLTAGCGGGSEAVRAQSKAIQIAPHCGNDPALAAQARRYIRRTLNLQVDGVLVTAQRGNRCLAAGGGSVRPSLQTPIPIGNLTKTFTAAIVLQLVGEGRIALDAPVERYLPGMIGFGRQITVRDLLQHRSSLNDYVQPVPRAELGPLSTPEHILRVLGRDEPVFVPGGIWNFSHANYVALGLIIERVTHHTYERELRTRLLEPLELRSTELMPRNGLPGGPWWTRHDTAWASLGLVSTPLDLERFYTALLDGRVLRPKPLHEMLTKVFTGDTNNVEARYAGMGIFDHEFSCGQFWGHSGGVVPYSLILVARAHPRSVLLVTVKVDRAWSFRPPRIRGAPTPPNQIALLACAGERKR